MANPYCKKVTAKENAKGKFALALISLFWFWTCTEQFMINVDLFLDNFRFAVSSLGVNWPLVAKYSGSVFTFSCSLYIPFDVYSALLRSTSTNGRIFFSWFRNQIM